MKSSDEREVDCWAAKQLRDDKATLIAAVQHFRARGWEYHPRYGTMIERAQRIISCSGVQGLADIEDIEATLSKDKLAAKQKNSKKKYFERKMKAFEYVLQKYHGIPMEMKEIIRGMKGMLQK